MTGTARFCSKKTATGSISHRSYEFAIHLEKMSIDPRRADLCLACNKSKIHLNLRSLTTVYSGKLACCITMMMLLRQAVGGRSRATIPCQTVTVNPQHKPQSGTAPAHGFIERLAQARGTYYRLELTRFELQTRAKIAIT